MRLMAKEVCECHNYCGDDERVRLGTHVCCKDDRDFPIDSVGRNTLESTQAEIIELKDALTRAQSNAQPDCRTCAHMSRNLCTLSSCVNADKYHPMVRLKCWKDGV